MPFLSGNGGGRRSKQSLRYAVDDVSSFEIFARHAHPLGAIIHLIIIATVYFSPRL